MRRVLGNIICISAIFFGQSFLLVPQAAAQSAGVVIHAFSPEVGSATEEFVELFNNSDTDLSVENWRLEYGSASAKTWTTKATLHGAIPARSLLLFATSGYRAAEQPLNLASGLARTGGHLRLSSGAKGQEAIYDLVGWGDAVAPEAAAMAAPAHGQELIRKQDEFGGDIDTNNNANDFDTVNLLTAPVSSSDPSAALPAGAPVGGYGGVVLSELLPDPASPATDSDDEYVELYNETAETIDLTGWQLVMGASGSTKQPLAGFSIGPNSYLVLFSKDTKISLSNTSSTVKLLAPDGSVLDSTGYEKPKTGNSWALIGDAWQWTGTPTAGSINRLTAVVGVASKTAASSNSSSKKSSTSSKSKAKTKKSTSVKGSATNNTNNGGTGSSDETPTPSPLQPTILAGVGACALLYALYEYRSDLANRFALVRRYFKNRRVYRQKT